MSVEETVSTRTLPWLETTTRQSTASIDLRSDTVTRPTPCHAGSHGGSRGRGRRLWGRPHRQPAGSTRGGDFWPRGRVVCSYRDHGQPDRDPHAHRAWPGGYLRIPRPPGRLGNGYGFGLLRMPAAHGVCGSRDPYLAADPEGDFPRTSFPLPHRADLSRKYAQHGRRHGDAGGDRRRNLERGRRWRACPSISMARASSMLRPR